MILSLPVVSQSMKVSDNIFPSFRLLLLTSFSFTTGCNLFLCYINMYRFNILVQVPVIRRAIFLRWKIFTMFRHEMMSTYLKVPFDDPNRNHFNCYDNNGTLTEHSNYNKIK